MKQNESLTVYEFVLKRFMGKKPKSNKSIEKIDISPMELLAIPSYHQNRDAVSRTAKLKPILEKDPGYENSQMYVVHVATCPVDVYNKKGEVAHKANSLILVDGNTRKALYDFFPNLRPPMLSAIFHVVKDSEALDTLYDSLDNRNAAEQPREKIQGIFASNGIVPESDYFKKGAINTFLNEVSRYIMDEQLLPIYRIARPLNEKDKFNEINRFIHHYRNEIIFFDKFIAKPNFPKKYKKDMFYISLFKMILKYGINNPRLLSLLNSVLNREKEYEDDQKVDAYTYFNEIYVPDNTYSEKNGKMNWYVNIRENMDIRLPELMSLHEAYINDIKINKTTKTIFAGKNNRNAYRHQFYITNKYKKTFR